MTDPAAHEEIDRKVQITSDAADKVIKRNARSNKANVTLVRIAATFVVIAVVYVCVILTLFAHSSISKQNTAHAQTGNQERQVKALEGQIISLLNGHSQDLAKENRILRQVLTVTSPQSRAEQAREGQAELRFVITCINNYALRSHENNHHQLISPLIKGCPFVALEHDPAPPYPGLPKDP